jgi:membrane-associated protein
MDIIAHLISFILHIDKHLNTIIQSFGSWSYLLLFVIIFAETGLVVTPFLPGDSLLFAAGAFAALGSFNIYWLCGTLVSAAILGDNVNYAIGRMLGNKAFQNSNSRIFKKEYLEKTHRFYEKYGGKTIIIAQFVPIIRTFAPFVAGVGRMSYRYFLAYNVAGVLLWVGIFSLGGYFFGNMPVIKEHFTVVVFIIIFVSILPPIIEYIRHKRTAKLK